MGSRRGVIGEGARIVWRRQKVLWWAFAVNLLLALMGTIPTAAELGNILNRSLASGALVDGFDVPTFAELAMSPARPLHVASAALFPLVFFAFMLFIEGGVLAVYRADRKFTTAEFFEACGRFFWRFFRLLILFLIVLVPIIIFDRVATSWSDRLAVDAPKPLLGIWVQIVATIIALFLLMAVRLWFDMAQARIVVEDERAVRKALWASLKLTLRRFPRLFGIYFEISLVAWAGLVASFWVWASWVRPEWTGVTFLLTQGFLLFWLATRFWQRASEIIWYLRHAGPPSSISP
jgi:hypothetical protein